MPNPSSFFRAVAARLSRVPPRLPPSAAARPPDCSVGRGGSLLRAGCAGLRASRGGDEMRTGVAAHPRVGLLTAPAAGWRSAARLAAPAEERLAGRGAGAGAGAGGCTVGAGRTVGVAAERRLPQASQSAPPPPGCRRCGALLRCCCVLPPPREDCDESQEPPNAPSSSPQTSSGSMPGGLQQPPPGSNRTCSTVAVASRRVRQQRVLREPHDARRICPSPLARLEHGFLSDEPIRGLQLQFLQRLAGAGSASTGGS